MKRIITAISIAIIAAAAAGCRTYVAPDPTTVDSFVAARPVWAEGRETEKNLTLSFRETIHAGRTASAHIRIAASTDYRLRVNGEFVAHGPCVAAHDFYRVDCYDIAPYMHRGDNIVAIEVAGYNEPSYYLLDQPSFLQAEVELNGECVAATGEAFTAYELRQRKADVPRFSFQRPFTEYYILTPDFDAWACDPAWDAAEAEAVTLAEQPAKQLLQRRVAYPDYRVHEAKPIQGGIYKFDCNSSGFLGIEVEVTEPSRLKVSFDELLTADGHVNIGRLGCQAYVTYELQPGKYRLESFEPYTMQYAEPAFETGSGRIDRIYMRDYCNADVHRGTFSSSNADLDRLFETARETHRQSALDVFMDTPSRERAGWLCDSYFSARVAFDLAGHTRLEKNFIENFLLPERFKDIDPGMLPMCYPSDHRNGNYIPNWAMWFVVELEEYLHRSGDTATIEAARKRVYDLVEYFRPYLNEDGLLEKLDRWIFVEWSAANDYVQDVNYPTNMLYAEMLDVVSRLYGDKALAEQAEAVRRTIREQSFDGRFFCDNAIREKDGTLRRTDNHTEVCQYYAFFFRTATPELYPELWARLRDEFGPARKQNNPYPDVAFANAFIGNYLRLELLSREGLSQQILDESIAEYLTMADQTGTLWENMTSVASCNHGFAAHLVRVLYRDVLGVYDISPTEKKIRLRFVDSGLSFCKGSIPVGEEQFDLEWRMDNGTVIIDRLSLPEGYTLEVMPASLPYKEA